MSNPTEGPQSTSKECMYTYWNLITCAEAQAPGRFFISALSETKQCDHIHNLKHVREKVEAELGPENYAKMLNFSQDPEIIKKSNDIVIQTGKWAVEETYKGLPFLDKLHFHTSYQYEKWASTWTIFGGRTGGGQYKRYRKIAQRENDK